MKHPETSETVVLECVNPQCRVDTFLPAYAGDTTVCSCPACYGGGRIH